MTDPRSECGADPCCGRYRVEDGGAGCIFLPKESPYVSGDEYPTRTEDRAENGTYSPGAFLVSPAHAATRERMAKTGENFTTAYVRVQELNAPCDCGAQEDPDGETMCNCTARREAEWQQ